MGRNSSAAVSVRKRNDPRLGQWRGPKAASRSALGAGVGGRTSTFSRSNPPVSRPSAAGAASFRSLVGIGLPGCSSIHQGSFPEQNHFVPRSCRKLQHEARRRLFKGKLPKVIPSTHDQQAGLTFSRILLICLRQEKVSPTREALEGRGIISGEFPCPLHPAHNRFLHDHSPQGTGKTVSRCPFEEPELARVDGVESRPRRSPEIPRAIWPVNRARLMALRSCFGSFHCDPPCRRVKRPAWRQR